MVQFYYRLMCNADYDSQTRIKPGPVYEDFDAALVEEEEEAKANETTVVDDLIDNENETIEEAEEEEQGIHS